MRRKAGNNVYLKEYNRRMLLSIVREHGSISYTKLSKISGLAPKSVYEIVNGLIEEGYIDEAFIGKSSGGRKPTMLSLKPKSYYSIGIDIDVGRIKTVLMDFIGDVLYEQEIKMNNKNYQSHINQIADIVNSIVDEYKIPNKNLLGVGLSVAGFINSATKKVVMAPNLGWENKDLIADLKNRLDYKVYIENEAMASAVCEKWIGQCKEDTDFICINIMSGIGAGIYASDKPLRGVSGSAGEIGHIIMDKNGPLCGCKNRGCLETFSSTTAILKRAEEVYKEKITLDRLIQLAKGGDERALGIFNRAADYLGIAICYLVNIFNPSKIVIGKDFTRYSDFMLDTVMERARTTSLKNNYSSVTITVSTFGEEASVLGAAMLPVRKLFDGIVK